MSDLAAMQGDFVDLKFLKSRKVIQVWIEIPIEAGAQFVSMFGTPDPSKTVPVALARIDPNAKATSEKPKRKWDELSIAQQAGIMCNEKGFQIFVNEQMEKTKGYHKLDEPTADDAAMYVRQLCGVNSRAHIEGKPEAERKFHDLRIAYDNWLRVPAQ